MDLAALHCRTAGGRAAAGSLAILSLLVLAGSVWAQAPPPAWTSLDGTPAGSEAQVVLDPTASGPGQTTFDLVIHGFYTTPRVGPDGTSYDQLTVPGLDRLAIQGAPEIPVLRAPLAILTDAANVSLVSMTPLSPTLGFPMHLWPQPVPGTDEPFATPEVFTLDPVIYASALPYPTSESSPGPINDALGSLRQSLVECHPIRWTPADDLLMIQPVTRWVFAHAGAPLALEPITRDRSRLAAAMFMNWGSLASIVAVNLGKYQGEYLFVYPTAYASAIQPLVFQKKVRGYTVATITTESLGGVTCASVRAAIQAWYNATPSNYDHYCLLVGGIGDIPFCPPPGSSDPYTDDLYGSMSNNFQPGRDIFVGRLPVQDATDVQHQVKKIIDYEDHPPGPLYYGAVLLVAHKPDYTQPYGDYEAQQELVRTQSYTVNPLFVSYYGSTPGRTNAGAVNHINSGYGITCYRGHGGPSSWSLWNSSGTCAPWWPTYTGECFTDGDVGSLSNGSLTTIVWAIACNNGDLRDASCIGAAWMRKFPGGAAAHYGSTRPSNTQDNNILEDSLFRAIWTKGMTNLAHATTWAEDKSIAWDYGYAVSNAWMYALFGDPDMSVRRQMPAIWQTVAPASIILPQSGQMSLDIHVTDAAGSPVVGALVGVWKPGGSPTPGMGATPAGIATAGDEVFDNAYSGADGGVNFQVAPQTTGHLYFTVRDTAGNSVADSIPVVSGTSGVPPGAAARLEMRAVPSVTGGATMFRFSRALDAPGSVRIFDAGGHLVAALRAPRGAVALPWSGTNRFGAPVRSGLYFAMLRGEGVNQVVRILVMR